VATCKASSTESLGSNSSPAAHFHNYRIICQQYLAKTSKTTFTKRNPTKLLTNDTVTNNVPCILGNTDHVLIICTIGILIVITMPSKYCLHHLVGAMNTIIMGLINNYQVHLAWLSFFGVPSIYR
jgi:hypothetical protein